MVSDRDSGTVQIRLFQFLTLLRGSGKHRSTECFFGTFASWLSFEMTFKGPSKQTHESPTQHHKHDSWHSSPTCSTPKTHKGLTILDRAFKCPILDYLGQTFGCLEGLSSPSKLRQKKARRGATAAWVHVGQRNSSERLDRI